MFERKRELNISILTHLLELANTLNHNDLSLHKSFTDLIQFAIYKFSRTWASSFFYSRTTMMLSPLSCWKITFLKFASSRNFRWKQQSFNLFFFIKFPAPFLETDFSSKVQETFKGKLLQFPWKVVELLCWQYLSSNIFHCKLSHGWRCDLSLYPSMPRSCLPTNCHWTLNSFRWCDQVRCEWDVLSQLASEKWNHYEKSLTNF